MASDTIVDTFGNRWQLIAECPLCGPESLLRVLWINESQRYQFRTDVATKLVRCTNCGLVWVTPRIVKVEAPKPMDSGVKSESEQDLALALKIRRQDLARLETYKPGGRLLDLGCGYGHFVRVARDSGWDAVGVEPRQEPVQYARDELGVDAFHGYLGDAGFPLQSFDVVVMEEVLEHLTDPVGVLRSVYTVLKDDGILFLRTCDISSLESRLKRQRWCMIYVNSHYYFYSPRSLGCLLDRVGMRIRERILWYPGSVWWKDVVKWGFAQLGIAMYHLTAVIEKRL